MSDAGPHPLRPPPRWRRRLRNLVLVALLVLIAVRAAVPLVLPSILESALEDAGLTVTYDDMLLDLMDGNVEFWHLRLSTRQSGHTYVDAEYVQADVSVLALLDGRLEFRRIEADGIDARIERGADGQLDILRHFAADDAPGGVPAPDEEPAGADPEGPADVQVTSPVVVDTLNLQHIRLDWRDESVAPVVETRLDMTLRVSALASPDEPTRLEFDLSAAGILDRLDVEAEGRTDNGISDLGLKLRMSGLRPGALPAYLALAGLRHAAERLDAAFDARLSLGAAAEAPGALAMQAQLSDLQLRADDVVHVSLDDVTLSAPVLGPDRIELSQVQVTGGRAVTGMLADGTLRLAGLDLLGAASAEEQPSSGQDSGGPAPDLRLGSLAIEDVRWDHTSHRTTPPLELGSVLQRAQVSNLVLPATRSGPPARFEMVARSRGLADSVRISGSLQPGPTATLDISVDARGRSGDDESPYRDTAALSTSLTDPRLHAALEANWTPQAAGGLTATARVHGVALTDGDQELAALDELRVDDVAVSPDGDVHVAGVTVTGSRLTGRRQLDGSLRLAGIALPTGPTTPAPASRTSTAVDSSADGGPAPAIVIDSISWRQNNVQLVDETVGETFELRPRVELRDLRLGGPSMVPSLESLEAVMELPGIARELSLTGAVVPDADDSEMSFVLRGSGLTGALVTPLLESAGLQRVMQDGSLQVDLGGRLGAGDRLEALAITGIELRDGGVPLLGCKAVELGGLQERDGITTVGKLTVQEPWIAVRRDAEGGLVAAGFRLPPPPSEPDGTEPSTSAAGPPAAGPGDAVASKPPPGGAGGPMTTVLEGLELSALQVRWTDELMQPPVETTLQLDVTVGRARLGGDGADAVPLALALTLADSDARVSLEGEVVPHPDDARLSLLLECSDLSPSAVDAYAGEDAFRLWNGDLRLELEAATRVVEDDGRRIRNGEFDLRVDHLAIHDGSRSDAASLDVQDVRLWTERPLALELDDPEFTPPVELRLSGKAPPLVDALSTVVVANLFDDEPSVTLEAAIDGVRGAALTDVFAGLSETLDASTLADGRFALKAGLYGRGRRKDAYSYDLSGKSLELEVTELSFRDGDGPVLAGIESLRAEIARIAPATGDVRIRTIEVTQPTARLARNDRGLQVLGVTLLDPVESPGESEADAAPGPEADDPLPVLGPEIRVESFSVQDLDFVYQDDTTTPPFRLPLTGLQLDVRGFSSHALSEPIPMRVSHIVLADAWNDEPGTPPLFDEIQVEGSLALAPVLDGWLRADVRSLELMGLAGPAAEAGIVLKGGTLDLTTDLRFADDGSLDASARMLFTDLDLTEPDDGPIARLLRLPTPTNVVLFVLQDENGLIDLPVDVNVPAGGVTTAEVTRLTVAALSSLILDALANSPFRVLSGMGDAAGSVAGNLRSMTGLDDVNPLGLFGFGDEAPESEPIGAVAFGPADATLPEDADEGLDDLARRLRDGPWVIRLGHELGALDVELAASRANPPPEQVRALAGALRRRRDALQQSHLRIVDEIGAAVGAGLQTEAEELRLRLALCDEELGNTETALDYTLDLLRPGAERQALRRTREACQAIAAARMLAVRNALVDQLGPDFDARVRMSRPRFREPVLEAGGEVTVSLVEAKEYRKGFWSRLFGWLPFVD